MQPTTHFILLCSLRDKSRIAFDVPLQLHSGTDDPWELVRQSIFDVWKVCGRNIKLSSHILMTDSAEWESVTASDWWFENVRRVETIETFTEIIKQDSRST